MEFSRRLTSHSCHFPASCTPTHLKYEIFNRKWNAQSQNAKCHDFNNITFSDRKWISYLSPYLSPLPMKFCIPVRQPLPVLDKPLQPRQIPSVPPRYRVPHDQPVKKFLELSRHLVPVLHPHARSASVGFNFPPLHPAYPIRILELPLQHAPALEIRHHRRNRKLSRANFPGQSDLLPVTKLCRASLHFELHSDLRSVPRPHPVRHEKCSDNFRSRGNVTGEIEVGHQRAAILPGHPPSNQSQRMSPEGAGNPREPGCISREAKVKLETKAE